MSTEFDNFTEAFAELTDALNKYAVSNIEMSSSLRAVITTFADRQLAATTNRAADIVRGVKRSLLITSSFMVVVVLVVVAISWKLYSNQEEQVRYLQSIITSVQPPFDPIRPAGQVVNEPHEQLKTSTIDGDYPTVAYDGLKPSSVRITGTRCNTSNQDVTTRSQGVWRFVEPLGTVIQASPGNGTLVVRPVGCVTGSYNIPMPQAIFDRFKDLHDTGVDIILIQLQGTDTPIKADGTDGVTRSWSTEIFAIKWNL